jgi:hypothetical protein
MLYSENTGVIDDLQETEMKFDTDKQRIHTYSFAWIVVCRRVFLNVVTMGQTEVASVSYSRCLIKKYIFEDKLTTLVAIWHEWIKSLIFFTRCLIMLM